MRLVLDSGALLAFDRGDRRVAATVEASRRRRDKILTSSGCVAQTWRNGGPRQALLARLLRGIDERGLDHDVSRRVGKLCADAAMSDVVDAHVALLARDDDLVVTSDVDGLQQLLHAAASPARVLGC